MRKLIIKALRFLPILIAVATINFYVDPSQLFGNGRLERLMADIMLRGENVANILNFDDRLLQKVYFNEMPTAKDIVVIGSSRSLLIRTEDVPGQSFYNSSVPGASVEDYIAISEMLEERSLMPSTIIVEVSPWIFNKNNGQTRWTSLGHEYLAGMKRLRLPVSVGKRWASLGLEKYARLFSLPYLQESTRWAGIRSTFYVSSDSETGEPMKLNDGSRVYDAQSQQISTEEVRDKALEAVAIPYSLTSFEDLDPDLSLQFETWLTSLQGQGVRVVVLLMPYHPDYYNALISSQQYAIVTDVEAYLNNFAQKNSLQLVGSYDPINAGCGADEYYDGLHARESCLSRILSEINWNQ